MTLALLRLGRSHRLDGVYIMALTFGHDGGTKAPPEVVRQFVEMRLAINLDGHLCCIANDVAVMAPLKMVFQFSFGLSIHSPVEVIG
jgi:hypothetical protein